MQRAAELLVSEVLAKEKERSISQEEMGGSCREIDDEVLGKYKVKVSKRGAGEPSEWRVKKYQPRKIDKDCWARIFSWFREYDLQRKQGMQEEPDGRGGDARTTRHLWMVQRKGPFIKAAEKRMSTSRSTGPQGEEIQRTYDYVIAGRSLRGKIRNVEAVEDFENHTRR